jgi:sialic acid synthase SpsE
MISHCELFVEQVFFSCGTLAVMQHNGKVRIIAEIGTGHNGDIEHARELIDASAGAGADFAKFQMVYAEEILHPDTGFVNLPGGSIRLYDRFRELEVPLDFYADCAEYCAKKGITFLCTPFGLRSLADLLTLKPSCIKIASPELNHIPLVQAAAASGLPLILSTGVSMISDIERALGVTEIVQERTLLHCITSYPAPEEEYNLLVLENLSRIFGVAAGVSDHSLDPVLVPVLSMACGGSMIEKHITLSRKDSGLDDPIALPPDQFAAMVNAVHAIEGTSKEKIIGTMEVEYGADRVARILGDGIKRLAPSERANYERTNRSIHFMRAMKAGERIGEKDIALLRTEKELNPGLSPEWLDTVTGARLVRDVTNGAGLRWEDIISR